MAVTQVQSQLVSRAVQVWECSGLSDLDIVKSSRALDCQDILHLSRCALVAPGCLNKTGFVLGFLMMFGRPDCRLRDEAAEEASVRLTSERVAKRFLRTVLESALFSRSSVHYESDIPADDAPSEYDFDAEGKAPTCILQCNCYITLAGDAEGGSRVNQQESQRERESTVHVSTVERSLLLGTIKPMWSFGSDARRRAVLAYLSTAPERDCQWILPCGPVI
ncbi:hypothetical protein F2P81_001587 [Scophthalmus maximus]|uniref:Uncharacterized protein n=1 Tax=Scophthalmus maximus TaxID=52904 RepID=A0A6A4TKP3_SCOMX|nr:hypothetical protein F2P81_001587 [Scophthalmus maximus]